LTIVRLRKFGTTLRNTACVTFIGKSGAILLGFPDTTQDADLYPERSDENCRRLVSALRQLGFALTEPPTSEIEFEKLGQRTRRYRKTEETFNWRNKTKDHVMCSIYITESKAREGQTVRVDAKDGALEFQEK
jgi:hypothetical protein